MTLFDVEVRRRRPTGTTAITRRTSIECVCGPVYRGTHLQPALFYHGGYGATERIWVLWCLCGRVRRRDVALVNPRRL